MNQPNWSYWVFLALGISMQFLIFCKATGPCALVEPHADALCIPLEAINRAFRDARLLLGLKYPFTFPPYETYLHHHDIDQLGMVLTETTKYLAKEFQLSHEQIYDLIPKLDLELTDIWQFCPIQFRHKACKLSKYRTLTGHCNNLNHPDWGATHSPFINMLPSQRPDGVEQPKDAEDAYLPPARLVSSRIHRDHVVHDHAITVMLIAWGQIIDHDITFTAETKDFQSQKDVDCCHVDHNGGHQHPNCYPIRIPEDDPFYSNHGHHCMNFARSFAGVRSECRLGPRTAFNTQSSFLDASFIYGSYEHLGRKLRTGKYGRLKSLPIFTEYGLKDLLPLKMDEPDDGCMRPNPDIFCFLAGDNRVNEQLVLTVLHTIFMREHNRIAHKLSKINPHWDDEKLYQETKRIITAIVQHITYEEFLPMVLGKELMHEYGISIEETGFWNGYDPNVNPTAAEEFITSAFRFGHSLLPHKIERWTHGHRYIGSTDLSKLIRQPFDLYRPGHVDTFIMGLINQLAQAMDEGVTEQVTTMLFKEPRKHFGMDLASMNIQRGRDHAVPGYSAFREICGLPRISNWDDLIGVMRNDTVYKYKSIYRSPHDIDLWSGGVSEISGYGSLLGPTFGCIISRQFQALRYGDRFWYELPDLPSSFTQDQLHEIKKMKLSRLLCDNSDALKTIQVHPMVYPDPHMNPRVPCQGHVIPRIDLEKWRDSPHSEHESQHLQTDHKHIHAFSNFKHQHEHGYQTLQPPKFDPRFLTSNSQPDTPYTNAQYFNEFEPQIHYNASYETTLFPTESPNYPEISNSVDYHSKNIYQGSNSHSKADSQSHSLNTPNYHYNQNYNTDSNPIDEGIAPYEDPFVKGDIGNLLETLEPPTVLATSLPFIPHAHYQSRPRPKVFVKRIRMQPKPFPNSPFPGLDGIFSPNPGYLVRQKFSVYKAPVRIG